MTVSSLACSPATLTGPATSACTVTLSGPAPTGGSAIALASNNASLTVPASLTIARRRDHWFFHRYCRNSLKRRDSRHNSDVERQFQDGFVQLGASCESDRVGLRSDIAHVRRQQHLYHQLERSGAGWRNLRHDLKQYRARDCAWFRADRRLRHNGYVHCDSQHNFDGSNRCPHGQAQRVLRNCVPGTHARHRHDMPLFSVGPGDFADLGYDSGYHWR